MAQQVDGVNAQAEDLASTAEQLRELVALFRLEQAAPAQKPSQRQPRRGRVAA
jgi:hypothetical protein